MAMRKASGPFSVEPIRQAIRGAVFSSTGIPEFSSASLQTAIVKITKAAFQLYVSFASMKSSSSGDQSGISPTMSQADSTLHRVTFLKPASPLMARIHVFSKVFPRGVAAP
jgi:hypothetical protein